MARSGPSARLGGVVTTHRRIAFDSNELTYMLDANSWPPNSGEIPEEEWLSAWRVFFYLGDVYILPTVAAEAAAIKDDEKRTAHERWIQYLCEEVLPERLDKAAVDRRQDELLVWHSGKTRDCRLVAEAEQSKMDVFLTRDADLRKHLRGKTAVSLSTAADFWTAYAIPHGTSPRWEPARR